MGKGNKPTLILPVRQNNKKTGGDIVKKGCNSPQGCLLNEDPPIDCSRNPDYVKVVCDNEKCPHNQYLHQKCYDHWEEKIIMGVQKSQSRTRDWTDEQVRRRMWTRIWDVSYRYCKCLCGGYLKRADALEIVEPPQGAAAGGQKNKPKNSKQSQPRAQGPLPKLVQPSRNAYTNKSVSPWTAAGGSNHSAGAAAKINYAAAESLNNSMESLQTAESGAQDNYIPGLFVSKEKEGAKNRSRLSTSSNEEKYTYDAFKRPSFTPPMMPPFRSTDSPSLSATENNGQDEDWHVVGTRKGKGDSTSYLSVAGSVRIQKIKNGSESEGPCAPASGTFDDLVADDHYKSQLEAHLQLSDPKAQYCYSRDLFEITSLLEEMNITAEP